MKPILPTMGESLKMCVCVCVIASVSANCIKFVAKTNWFEMNKKIIH